MFDEREEEKDGQDENGLAGEKRERERHAEIFTLTKFTMRILSKNSFRRKDAIQETHNEGSEGGVYVVNYCALINSCLEELCKNCPSQENLVEARVRCFLSTVETLDRAVQSRRRLC